MSDSRCRIADGKLLVETPLGTLVAYIDANDDNPSIYIDLRRPGFGVDAPVAAIACEKEDGRDYLRSAVWKDVNDSDNAVLTEHSGIKEFFTMDGPSGMSQEYPPEGL